MSPSARVTSLQPLEDFKAALCRFGVDAGNALAGLDRQIRRAFDWLEGQGKYWQREVRRREETVIRVHSELLQRKADRQASGGSYTEPELALEAAQEALKAAQKRLQSCRRWTMVLPQEVIEYERSARQLSGVLETELRRAVAMMEQRIRALEDYIAVTAPSTPLADAAEPPLDAHRRLPKP